jgi:hypothetical protein
MAETNVLEFPVKLVPDTCGACGIKFAIPDHLMSSLRKTHKEFYCPNGHNLVYSAESDKDRLVKKDQIISQLRSALTRISRLEVGTFNKHSLELAIEVAENALKCS